MHFFHAVIKGNKLYPLLNDNSWTHTHTHTHLFGQISLSWKPVRNWLRSIMSVSAAGSTGSFLFSSPPFKITFSMKIFCTNNAIFGFLDVEFHILNQPTSFEKMLSYQERHFSRALGCFHSQKTVAVCQLICENTYCSIVCCKINKWNLQF